MLRVKEVYRSLVERIHDVDLDVDVMVDYVTPIKDMDLPYGTDAIISMLRHHAHCRVAGYWRTSMPKYDGLKHLQCRGFIADLTGDGY